MTPMITDPVLCMKFSENGELVGMNGSYVDDQLRAGIERFSEIPRRTRMKFDISGDEEPAMTFAVLEISKLAKISYAMDKAFYLRKLEPLAEDSSWNEFSSKRMQLAWTANTRPDLCIDISHLASVTKESFTENNEK